MNSPPSDNDNDDLGPAREPTPQARPPPREKTQIPKQVARVKERPSGDEEVGSSLKLGEFQGVHSLSVSEARILVNAVFKDRKQRRPNWNWDKENITKMVDYLEEFSRFKQTEANESLERVLDQRRELEYFERSQLANLCPESADEAKTLIPSITNKISDDDLQELLNEIGKLRQFAE
ncbi:hypothetical protein EJ05DRAFT_479738 [Pseudovirgaria hyperparasitica]|uniref:RNA polymerase Rpb4/RPC9 core domain-containing protein n=1 Tax=Pseudovirgaria hyperparasitica TaxID=470096 RepID=A0A6A6VWN9_9PEZI|nr:uncharacterized protein EJ05DRAFT_479738 [Pseudovirgaria hyperparasitica]KAF2754206.1 hypothetical protein EJ05DRAFT_479738 [Pseudovirgaria hyperparasitica]